MGCISSKRCARCNEAGVGDCVRAGCPCIPVPTQCPCKFADISGLYKQLLDVVLSHGVHALHKCVSMVAKLQPDTPKFAMACKFASFHIHSRSCGNCKPYIVNKQMNLAVLSNHKHAKYTPNNAKLDLMKKFVKIYLALLLAVCLATSLVLAGPSGKT